MLKWWNHSTATKNYAVTYYEILEEVPWHLGLKKHLGQNKKFSKSLKKIVKISKKLRVFSDRCCSTAATGRGDGGLQLFGGATAWWGGNSGGGVNMGGVFNH